MANRLDPSWSFPTLFLVKDGLAGQHVWVAVGVHTVWQRTQVAEKCRGCPVV